MAHSSSMHAAPELPTASWAWKNHPGEAMVKRRSEKEDGLGEPVGVGSTGLPAAEDAWAAILRRDGSWDGVVYYAVATTGVYCRPSCSAKRPNRENVEFFASPETAEEAGFRACKRCRPASSAAGVMDKAVKRAQSILDRDGSMPLQEVAAQVAVSPHHLHRVFKRSVGLSPKEYGDARRMQQLRERLREGDTVSRATFEAGFGSSRAVYEKADAALGMSPATYRQGAPGVVIGYAQADTAFGHLLVAATERGICFVALSDSRDQLIVDLQEEFPKAHLKEADDALQPWVQAITEHLTGSSVNLELPTDLAGTDFQARVWRALKEIPYGETRSYGEVAQAVGKPSAARAVARACATNRAALVVPCHRVVRESGELGGYRWGLEVKRDLLEQERRLSRMRRQQTGRGADDSPDQDG